jgi:predicted nucleotidyltransferase
MPFIDTLRERKTDVLAVAARHGACNIRVFGSVARGEDIPGSDVDLLVDFDPDRSLFDLVGLQLDLESLLDRRTDIVTEGGLSAYLRERVLAEARPL